MLSTNHTPSSFPSSWPVLLVGAGSYRRWAGVSNTSYWRGLRAFYPLD